MRRHAGHVSNKLPEPTGKLQGAVARGQEDGRSCWLPTPSCQDVAAVVTPAALCLGTLQRGLQGKRGSIARGDPRVERTWEICHTQGLRGYCPFCLPPSPEALPM